MKNTDIVHVLDRDGAARRSVAGVLSAEGYAVSLHETPRTLLDGLADDAGCVITDLEFDGMTGIDLLALLRVEQAGLPAIVLTGRATIPLAVEAMRQGASDFLQKPCPDGVLLAAVRSALRLRVDAGPQAARRAAIRRRLGTVSGRERQVLDGLIAGKANKAIALDLDISPRTVEIHRAKLMEKMEAHSLPELVQMALAAGLPGPVLS